MNNLSFETLLKEKGNKSSERWYPITVKDYELAFNIDTSIENSHALQKNLAYSMQYLQFLEKEMAELEVSSVIYVMLVKTYVITGMSVLEGLFTNIVKSNGWWKTTDLESLGTTQANETNFDGQSFVVKTEIMKKVSPYQLQMNMDEIIKILSRHHQALAVNHLVYPALKRLKDLRNRIHLQKTDCSTDHDYNAFDYNVKQEMGSILYEILTSKMITNLPQHFEFLKVNLDNN